MAYKILWEIESAKWDLRVKRARFSNSFALKRPYFVIRAKSPQIVLDEVDNIIDELNKE